MAKKFVLRLLFFCLLPLPFLYALNYMVDTGLRNLHSYYYAEWNDIFHSKINSDLLIIGSSRAWVHISPKILDSVLKMHSYNLGLDASHFLMQYSRFKLYLKYNKKPRYVLISVDLTTFSETNEIPFPQQFLPYLSDPDIKKMIAGFKNSFTPAQLYFPLFKYNNEPELFTKGIKAYFGKTEIDTPVKYKGYLGVQRGWDGSFDQYKKDNPKGERLNVSLISKNAFNNLLLYCKLNNIKAILVFTPVFYNSLKYITNSNNILSYYTGISAQYNIPFLNYAQDTLCYQRKYFYNSQHLNKTGSELFSYKFANDLKQIIRN